jgi:tRNA-intron endonuclease, archaea type
MNEFQLSIPDQSASTAIESEPEALLNEGRSSNNSSQRTGRDQDFQQVLMQAVFSKRLDHVALTSQGDVELLESKGFGIRTKSDYYLKDYEVLYLMYIGKLELSEARGKTKKGQEKKSRPIDFTDFVSFALERDENAWTRFLIFRDLRSRGYVVREGFGFPIDFRVYERGDYGSKAAKYIVFGLNEGKTMTVGELKKHVDQMSTMGKEAVIAVVERRGEVIYYKVGKWRPIKPLS